MAAGADATLVRNEQLKLTAGYLNTGATMLFGAGVVVPLAAAVYGLSGSGGLVGPLTLGIGLTTSFAVNALFHLAARAVPTRLRS